MGGLTISGWVTVDATKASQIGKKITNTPRIMSTWVSHSPAPRFSTMPWTWVRAVVAISSVPAFRYT